MTREAHESWEKNKEKKTKNQNSKKEISVSYLAVIKHMFLFCSSVGLFKVSGDEFISAKVKNYEKKHPFLKNQRWENDKQMQTNKQKNEIEQTLEFQELGLCDWTIKKNQKLLWSKKFEH